MADVRITPANKTIEFIETIGTLLMSSTGTCLTIGNTSATYLDRLKITGIGDAELFKVSEGSITLGTNLLPDLTDTRSIGSSVKWFKDQFVSQINATIFAEQTISLVGGWMVIGKNQVKLPAVTAVQTQIDFGTAMTPNDFIVIKAHDASNTIKTEYMQIGSLVSGTLYNVTRDIAAMHGTDPVWTDGTPGLVLGTTGDGRIEFNAYDTPRISVLTQGATYNAQTEVIRLGDLNGIGGISGQKFGIYIGTANNHMQYNATDDALIVTGTIKASAGYIGGVSSGWAIGSNILSGGSGATYIGLDQANSKIRIGAKTSLLDANTGVHLGSDGLALGASSVFTVTAAGVLTASSATITGVINANTGYLGGATNYWSITAGLLTSVGTASIVMATASSTIKVGAATTIDLGAGIFMDGNGNFRAGTATAGTDFIKATTTALTIKASTFNLYTTTLKISSTPYISLGATTPTSATVGTGIWIDGTGLYGLSANTQNFKISATDGSITAISGTVGGWSLAPTVISNNSVLLSTNSANNGSSRTAILGNYYDTYWGLWAKDGGFAGTPDNSVVNLREAGLFVKGSKFKAANFNGTNQYMQIALPNNILTGNTNDFTSSGTRPTGWVTGVGETWNDTSQVGMTGTYALKISASGGYSAYQNLTIGKKYKLKLRYIANATLRIGSSATGNNYANLGATSDWNTATLIFTATSATIGFNFSGAGTAYIDVISIKEDQGFNLNKDQEQILHSKNWDFERTLVTTYASNFSAGVDGWANYINTSVAGNIDNISGENDCLEVTVLNNASTPRIQKLISGLSNGKRYVLKFRTFTNSVASATYQAYTGNVQQTVLTATKIANIWQTHEVEFLCTGTDASGLFEINFTGAINDKWYLKDFVIQEIPNLVTNGTFTGGSTGWNLGTGWAYGSDKVTHTAGTASAVSQTLLAITGTRRFRTVYTVSGMTTGSIYIQLSGGGGGNGTSRTADGTYTQDIVAGTASQGVLYFLCSADFDGSIDNIHIYEIPEWTATGNHVGDISILDKSGTTGTQSYKITASGAGDATTNRVILPSANIESCVREKKYTLQLESRLDASSLSYGSNLITSWVDSNANGVIDIVNNNNPTYFADKTPSVKTAGTDGFTGIAQRIELASGSGLNIWLNGIIPNTRVYKVVFKYRSSKSVTVQQGGNVRGTLNANTGNAIESTVYISQTLGNEASIRFVSLTSTVGEYLEIGDISLYEATPITLTASLGGKSVTSSALSIVSGTFTKTVLNFLATSAEESKDLILYLSGAGSVFVDKLSLTQAYDWGIKWTDKIFDNGSDQTLIAANTNQSATNLGFFIYRYNSNNFLSAFMQDGSGNGANIVNNLHNDNETADYLYLINRTSNATGYKNNTLYGTNASGIGKVIFAMPFTIGKRADGSSSYFAGQISHIQIWRFDNIGQSNFNPNTYKPGDAITGGGVEEVLRIDWSNVSGTTVYDSSPRKNDGTWFGDALTVSEVQESTLASTEVNGTYIGNWSPSFSFNGVILDNTGLYGYDFGSQVFKINYDGALLAGWNFDSSALWSGVKTTTAGYATNNGDITISSTTGISTKNFYIDLAGNAYFKGDISAASGTFTGSLAIGSGNTIFKADSNGIYLGNATFASAPFSVTPAGVLKATSGTIANWTLSATSIQTGAFDTVSTMYFGTSGLSLSNTFKVTAAGVLTATGATISGVLTATSGTFTGTINANAGNFTSAVTIGNGATSGTLNVGTHTNKIVIIGTNANTTTAIYGGQTGYATGSGFWMDASGRFSVGTATNYLKFAATGIEIATSQFSLTSAGVATFSGALSAASGSFAGSLSAVTGTLGALTVNGTLTLGTGTIASTNFNVTSAGVVTATSATITGTINATGGYFGTSSNGWNISSNTITANGTGLFQTSASANTGIKINSTAIAGYNGTVQTLNLATDGSGWVGLTGTRAIEWTTAGAVKIAGWNLDTVKILNTAFADDINTRVMLANTSVTPSSGSNLGHAIGLSIWKRYNDNIYYNISIGKGLISTGTDWYTPTNTGSSAVRDANRVGIQFINWNGGTISDKVLFEVSQDTTVTNGSTGAGFKAVIAGWKFDHDALYTGTKVTAAGYSAANGDITISRTTGISAKNFYLDLSGNAFFRGDISAASGTFSGNLSIGSSNSIFKADSSGIYLGNATFASAPFSVNMSGALKSTSGIIAGWTIDSDTIKDNTAVVTSKVFLTKNTAPTYFDLNSTNLNARKTAVISWGPSQTYTFDDETFGWDLTSGNTDIDNNWIRFNASGDYTVCPNTSVNANTAYILYFNLTFATIDDWVDVEVKYYNSGLTLLSTQSFSIPSFSKLIVDYEKEILTPANTAYLTVRITSSDWTTATYLKTFSISSVSSLVEISSKGLLVWTGNDTYFKAGDGSFILKGGTIDTSILNASELNATSKLVASMATINTRLYFGSAKDTNLYRSAANTLKTDDALIVTGSLTTAGFPLCRWRGELSTAPTTSLLGGDTYYHTGEGNLYMYITAGGGNWIAIGTV